MKLAFNPLFHKVHPQGTNLLIKILAKINEIKKKILSYRMTFKFYTIKIFVLS